MQSASVSQTSVIRAPVRPAQRPAVSHPSCPGKLEYAEAVELLNTEVALVDHIHVFLVVNGNRDRSIEQPYTQPETAERQVKLVRRR
jgi:hypothetical protein